MKGLITIITVLAAYISYSQEITLDNTTVDLKNISINGEPYLAPNTKKAAQDDIKIFGSVAGEYFVLSNKQVFDENSAQSKSEYKGTLKVDFIDKKGNKIWSKNFDHKEISRSFISEKSKLITLKLDSDYEKDTISELHTYDNSGKLMYIDYNAKYLYPSINNDIIVYSKDVEYSGNMDNSKKLFVLDLKQNIKKSIELNFDEDINLYAISGNGEIFICNYVYSDITKTSILSSYNSKGELIWKKEFNGYPGYGSISYSGKYFLRITEYNKYELYNNKGELILTKNSVKIENKLFEFDKSSFVFNGADCFAIASPIAPKTIMVVIYDIEGNIIKYSVFKDAVYYKNIYVEKSKENSYEVYFDGIYSGSF